MTTATLGVPSTVSEELISEINSIKAPGDVTKPAYTPEAWTREGRTD